MLWLCRVSQESNPPMSKLFWAKFCSVIYIHISRMCIKFWEFRPMLNLMNLGPFFHEYLRFFQTKCCCQISTSPTMMNGRHIRRTSTRKIIYVWEQCWKLTISCGQNSKQFPGCSYWKAFWIQNVITDIIVTDKHFHWIISSNCNVMNLFQKSLWIFQ